MMEDRVVIQQTQYLRFILNGMQYAFDVLLIREIISLVKITPLPSSLDYLAGVINLRGSVVPVVDLRVKFGLVISEPTPESSIIIIELPKDEEILVLGILVDGVRSVMKCETQELEPPPKFGMQIDAQLVRAIARKNDDFIVILDAQKILSDNDLAALSDEPA